MEKVPFIRRAETAKTEKKAPHPAYQCTKRTIVDHTEAEHFDVAVYEVPPGKAAVPYHHHVRNEEVFYILRGTGLLRTPKGEKTVTAGDFIYFPPGEAGAHKLTNASESETLAYADFDIRYDPEIAFYPDSGKVGIFGTASGTHIFKEEDATGYYEGE